MSNENITIQDCLENYYYRSRCVVLENGQVVGFEKRESMDINSKNALQVSKPYKANM